MRLRTPKTELTWIGKENHSNVTYGALFDSLEGGFSDHCY